MDTILFEVLIGLVINGLSSAIAHLFQQQSPSTMEYVREQDTPDRVQSLHTQAAQAVSSQLEWHSSLPIEIVCIFLQSAEAEAIVRQLYYTRFTPNESHKTISSIHIEFLASFALTLASYSLNQTWSQEELVRDGEALFKALLQGCDSVFHAAIDAGILSAHEAASSLRQKQILSQLAALQENVLLLTHERQPNLAAIRVFEQQYRDLLEMRWGSLTPPDFDRMRRIPLDDLYVLPNFVNTAGQDISYALLLSQLHRTVVLGQPGSGKTTLVSKICHDLLMASPQDRLIGGRKELTPLIVELRKYEQAKRANGYSIIEFLTVEVRSDLQLTPPISAIQYLLLNNRGLVIFDGLDELLKMSQRHTIVQDIEAFCAVYSSVPVLVTSREVGYEQAPLNEDLFSCFHLAPFTLEQIRTYTQKWFQLHTHDNLEQQQGKVQAFLVETLPIRDLCTNPLILALLCNIYRHEHYLPENRPDVYKKCALMLFERWDTRRKIQSSLSFAIPLLPVLMSIAAWIYTGGSLVVQGVTEDQLVEHVKSYLLPRRFEDDDVADQAAQEFVAFCTGRAWVFTDIGTAHNGKRLYRFTHQTFLEYFAAAYVCRTHSTSEALMQTLRPHIAKGEWDTMAQIAVQIHNEQIEDASTLFLNALFESLPQTTVDEEWHILLFLARSLTYVVPSPSVTMAIVRECVRYIVEWEYANAHIQKVEVQRKQPPERAYQTQEHLPEELLEVLLQPTPENWPVLLHTLEMIMSTHLREQSENHTRSVQTLVLLEMLFYLEEFLRSRQAGEVEAGERLVIGPYKRLYHDVMKTWQSTREHLIVLYIETIRYYSTMSIQIGAFLLLDRKIAGEDFVRWHGVAGLYTVYQCTVLSTPWKSVATQLLSSALSYLTARETVPIPQSISILQSLGRFLLHHPLPWLEERPQLSMVHATETFSWVLEEYSQHDQQLYGTHVEAELLFALYVLLVLLIEIHQNPFVPSNTAEEASVFLGQIIEKKKHPLFTLMNAVFLAPDNTTSVSQLQEALVTCKFSDEQQRWILQLIQRKTSIMRRIQNEEGEQSELGEMQMTQTPQLNILITDDRRELVSLMARVLKDEWPDVVIRRAYSGMQALEMIEQHPPSLLLLDLILGEMSGLEVLHILETSPEKFPVLVVSASFHHIQEVQAIAPHLSRPLIICQKPFELETLFEVVGQLLFRTKTE